MKRLAIITLLIGLLIGLVAETPTPTVAKARATTMRAEIERLESRISDLKEQLNRLEEMAGTQAATKGVADRKLISLLASMPFEQQPIENETTFAKEKREATNKEKREAWIAKNISGKRLTFDLIIDDVTSNIVLFAASKLNSSNTEFSLWCHSNFHSAATFDVKDMSWISEKKRGEKIRVEGTIDNVSVNSTDTQHSITVEFSNGKIIR